MSSIEYSDKFLGLGPLSSENFECGECKKTFKYVSHFQRHVLTHSDVRPFECGCCGKKFKRQDALSTHELTHSDKLPFLCSHEECGERFASKAALRYHELRHNNQTEFICEKDNCNKKFLTLGQLKQHQRTKIHQASSNSFSPPPFQQPTSKPETARYSSPSYPSSYSDQLIQIESTVSSQNFGLMKDLMDNVIDSSIDVNTRNRLKKEDRNANDVPPQRMAHFRLKKDFPTQGHSSLTLNNIPNNNINNNNNNNNNNSNNNNVNHTQSHAHQQEETFLDEYSQEEQAFIDQIWSSIKQENISGSPQSQEKQMQTFDEKCNGARAPYDYPMSKKRRVSANGSVSNLNKQSAMPDQSNLLMEFSRLNSSSSSFGMLKQELRIIVGLIGKIKKEDEDMQNPSAQEAIPPFERNSSSTSIDNNTNQQQATKVQQKTVKSEESSQFLFFNPSGSNHEGGQDYYFYQNDENPFHDYACQSIHKLMPPSVLDPFPCDLENILESKQAPSASAAAHASDQERDLEDRPLLRKKIQTAVRLVHLCKKSYLEEKKKQSANQQFPRMRTNQNYQYTLSPEFQEVVDLTKNDFSFVVNSNTNSISNYNNNNNNNNNNNYNNYNNNNIFPINTNSIITHQPQALQDQVEQIQAEDESKNCFGDQDEMYIPQFYPNYNSCHGFSQNEPQQICQSIDHIQQQAAQHQKLQQHDQSSHQQQQQQHQQVQHQHHQQQQQQQQQQQLHHQHQQLQQQQQQQQLQEQQPQHVNFYSVPHNNGSYQHVQVEGGENQQQYFSNNSAQEEYIQGEQQFQQEQDRQAEVALDRIIQPDFLNFGVGVLDAGLFHNSDETGPDQPGLFSDDFIQINPFLYPNDTLYQSQYKGDKM